MGDLSYYIQLFSPIKTKVKAEQVFLFRHVIVVKYLSGESLYAVPIQSCIFNLN